MQENFSKNFSYFRRQKSYTQEQLAKILGVSPQAISKYENGLSYPDMELLPMLADVFETSVDEILGYEPKTRKIDRYLDVYQQENYYWGLAPSFMCYEVMRLRPPVKRLRLLDIGCGEGKDALFFARNGYDVTAFDLSEEGVKKTRELAERFSVKINAFQSDVNTWRLEEEYDIIFSSGMFHYIHSELRGSVCENIKRHTAPDGIHMVNVFVKKPFVPKESDAEIFDEDAEYWKSGELAMQYHDWYLHQMYETVFDCNSGGVPHKHCMDVILAENLA